MSDSFTLRLWLYVVGCIMMPICKCAEHNCSQSMSSPCFFTCDASSESCEAGDRFNCFSDRGCVIDCSSEACNGLHINHFGYGITNVLCTDYLSCADLTLNVYHGYLYILCASNRSCVNLDVVCYHGDSSARCMDIHCSGSGSCGNISTVYYARNATETDSTTAQPIVADDPNEHNASVFASIFTRLSLFEFMIIVMLALICCVNVFCCGYWTCFRNMEDFDRSRITMFKSGETHDEENHRYQHEQHVEALKQPNHAMEAFHTTDDTDGNSNGYGNEYETRYIRVDNAGVADMDGGVAEEEPHFSHSHNDLQNNALALDLHELDESLSSYNGQEPRVDPDITFWSELPPSPKKQDNIDEEKKQFNDGDNGENDGGVKDVHVTEQEKEQADMTNNEIPVPEFSNRDPNLPIPQKFEDKFMYLNPGKLASSTQFSIISPRNFSSVATHGIDKQNPTPSPKITQRRSDEQLNVIEPAASTAAAADAHSQYEVKALDERDVQRLIMSKSSNPGVYGGNKQHRPREIKNRKSKDKYRETISCFDGPSAAAELMMDETEEDEDELVGGPCIVKFAVNTQNGQTLTSIIEQNSEHTTDGRAEAVAHQDDYEYDKIEMDSDECDDDDAEDDDDDWDERNTEQAVAAAENRNHTAAMRFKQTFFVSPKTSKSASKSPAASISPRNILHQIIRGSPRNMTADADNNQLLIPPIKDRISNDE